MGKTAEHEVVVPTERLSVRLVLHTGMSPESFAPHWHSSFEINCMLRWPESEVSCGKRSWRMQTGRIWLANSQEVHSEHTLRNDPLRRATSIIYPYPYLMRIFPAIEHGHFELNDIDQLDSSQLAAYYGMLYPRFARLAQLLGEAEEGGLTRYIELASLPLDVLRILAEHFFVDDEASGHAPNEEYVERTHRIVDYVEANYASDIKLEDIADLCHLSRGYTARIVKESLGSTLGEYVAQVRATHARDDLLAHRGNQTEVAALNGYSGTRTMNRQLKQVFGRSAKELLQEADGV